MKRLALVFVALASLALIATACGGGGTSGTATTGGTTPSTSPTGGSSGGGSTTLTMQNIAFSPTSLSVAAGSTIQLVNKDGVTHTFTVNGQNVDVTIDGNQTSSATIDLPAGSYDFHCKIHPTMTGTLTVTG